MTIRKPMKKEKKTEGQAQHFETDLKQVSRNWVNPSELVGHKWIQQGPYLICQSCELKHAVYIGVEKHLLGYDKEGKPVIKPTGQ